MEPVYYGHLGTGKKHLDYHGVLIFQFILYEKVPFGTLTKYLDYAEVSIFSRFHCKSIKNFKPINLIKHLNI